MNLPHLAIKNYRFVIMLVLLGLVIGTYSFFTMSRSEDPALNLPFYTVVAIFPGTSPQDMEDLVVEPIEERINEMEDVKEIDTEIQEGIAEILIEMNYGVDADEKHNKIRAEIQDLKEELPQDLAELMVTQYKPRSNINILQLAIISSSGDYLDLKDWAQQLEKRLDQVNGVKNASIAAEPAAEIQIRLDFQEMASRNITLGQVMQVLKGANRQIPGGNVDADSKSVTINSSGSYQDLEQLENTIVHQTGTGVVFLKDIARLVKSHEEMRWLARHNTEKCVYVNVTQEAGTNILSLAGRLQQKLAVFEQSLPENIALAVAYQQAPAVESRINNFFITLLEGMLLVGLVLFLFLGFRPALLVSLLIPMAALIAIGALDLSGLALQQVSIGALIIALGILVDNGIVVVENTARYQQEGYPPLQAAAAGTSEIGSSIITATVTSCLAFLPMAMMGTASGDYVKSLPITVIFTLLASLILALSLIPFLAGKLIRPQNAKPNRLGRVVNRFADQQYEQFIRFLLRKKWIVFTGAVMLLAGSLSLFPLIGVSYFPIAEKPLLLIDIETPDGSNLHETDRATRYVENILDTMEYVESFTANTGHSNPQIYYNRLPTRYRQNIGQVMVRFESWDKERFYRATGQLDRLFAHYPGAKITFRELKNGEVFEAPIHIRLLGPNLDTLTHWSNEIARLIRKTEGTKEVNNPFSRRKLNLNVNLDRVKAQFMGLSLPQVDLYIRTAINGHQFDEVMLEDNESYPLKLMMNAPGESEINNLGKIYVPNQNNRFVPLRQVTKLTYESSVPKIDHFNTQRSVSITSNVVDPDETSSVTQKVINKLDKVSLPAGYSYFVTGELEKQQETFGNLQQMLVIAILAIFAVLVLKFNSFAQPFIIFAALPFALAGSFISLYLTGWTFSFLAFVGFISLIGIVVNDSIILVNHANQLREKGMEFYQALLLSCKRRFIPVILTTLTTIAGLLPLTLTASKFWSPLCWTIIGGLFTSSMLTLVIIPVLYDLFTKKKKV